MTMKTSISVRPYHLMCLFCRVGKGSPLELVQGPAVENLLQQVRRRPQQMLELNCNCSSAYSVQNPGCGEDAGGALLNRRRDLNILRFLKMTPGQAKPADDLIEQVGEVIKSPRNFCVGNPAGGATWQGCPYAESGFYELAQKLPSGREVLPQPTEECRSRIKRRDVAAIKNASILRIRPHHLLCMCCFYGQGILDGKYEPIAEDNLYEVIARMVATPDIPVELTEGCCCICPPCSRYQVETNWCLGGGMALRDEHKDLEVLFKLGAQYGDVIPARELYRRLFAAVGALHEICAFSANPVHNGQYGPNHEWRWCGRLSAATGSGEAAYQLARRDGLGIPGLGVSIR